MFWPTSLSAPLKFAQAATSSESPAVTAIVFRIKIIDALIASGWSPTGLRWRGPPRRSWVAGLSPATGPRRLLAHPGCGKVPSPAFRALDPPLAAMVEAVAFPVDGI